LGGVRRRSGWLPVWRFGLLNGVSPISSSNSSSLNVASTFYA